MKVEWSPLVLDRVSEIARYIAKDNPNAAERWVNELFDSVGMTPASSRTNLDPALKGKTKDEINRIRLQKDSTSRRLTVTEWLKKEYRPAGPVRIPDMKGAPAPSLHCGLTPAEN